MNVFTDSLQMETYTVNFSIKKKPSGLPEGFITQNYSVN